MSSTEEEKKQSGDVTAFQARAKIMHFRAVHKGEIFRARYIACIAELAGRKKECIVSKGNVKAGRWCIARGKIDDN